MTPTPRSDPSPFGALWRMLAIVAVLSSAWIAPTPALSGSQILDVVPGDDPDTLDIWVRDAGDTVPMVTIDNVQVELLPSAPEATNRYKPLTLVVDTSNITANRLRQIQGQIKALVKSELETGSIAVFIKYPTARGTNQLKLQKLSDFGENSMAWKSVMADLRVVENPEPREPFYSKLGGSLTTALATENGTAKRKVWAVVFSSLCMSPEEPPLDLGRFTGPIHLITWDEDLDGSCTEGKEKWLEASKNEQLKVHKLGTDDGAIKEALKGQTAFKDVKLNLTNSVGGRGINYKGGEWKLDVRMPGAPDEEALQLAFSVDILPKSWGRAAKQKAKDQRIKQVAIGFAVLLVLVLIGVIVQARSSAVDFAKWEAVGEAVDLATPLVDPDAWNATIFQLTGAMPIITEAAAKTAQLGPAAAEDVGDATKVQRKPKKLATEAPAAPAPGAKAPAPAAKKAPAPAAKKAPAPAAAATEASDDDASVTRTAEQPQAAGTVGDDKTGMTVSMGIVDTSSTCDALTPFEIGVLQEGKPVARKTKMFRKSFSIGRATDNRVVIQKDDTVHRYHVVIRPAVEGKEWWLEVSPTASNRTRLNAKDLRPGGRYRVPGRFRLQLGESTEVRGRLSKK